jgi:hypothetical protein
LGGLLRVKTTLYRTVLTILLAAGSAAQQAKAGDDPWYWDWGWKGPKKPTVDLTYGSGVLRGKAFAGDFKDIGSFELKLGYTRMRGGPSLSIDDKFLFGAAYDDATPLKASDGDAVGSKMIRIGFGSRGGYAYDFDAVYLYPYNEQTFSLTKMDFARPSGLNADALNLFARYEGPMRFGYSSETGLAVGVSELIAFRAGYDLTVINPRVMFWKLAGSYIIATAGYGVISSFGREIVNASPQWGPIVYALLRGAYTYAYYLAVRDKMNWPFNTEKPLTSQMAKVGVTFTF